MTTLAATDLTLRRKLRAASVDELAQWLITLTLWVRDASSEAEADEFRLQREFVVGELKRRAGGS